jgi:GT2 family glycosyltransferase
VRHIPAPLCQRPPRPAGDDAAAFERAALQRHLARSGALADVADTRPGCRRLRYARPATPPRVSIVIPNKDRCALLRQCVDSILARTAYADWEILVVDNGSTEPATLAYLDTLRRTARVRVLDDPRPFNFSAMNNLAAEQASGEVLCLLNNDTEVITPDWLDDMLGYLHQRDVGVVGAKLLYPDGRVQHAGDAVGVGGCADHMHSMIDGDAPGYCDRALIAQEVSAVTAACLLTWKTLYRRLGGLNASHLKVAFNDVDYCLRVWEAGYRVIWTPHARLTHHESATRGRHRGPDAVRATRAEAGYVRKRWPDRMRHDPFYNPNLNAAHADFTLSPAPRIDTPWSP